MSKLKPAWLGWPNSKNELFALSFYNTVSSRNLVMYLRFNTEYAAQKFIHAVGTYTWLDRVSIQFEDTRRICISQELERILNHTLSDEEEQWTLPIPYDTYAAAIGNRRTERREEAISAQAEKSTDIPPKPKQRETKPSVPRADRSALVTIQQIAEELKTEPRALRSILRDKQEPKPDVGWAWSPTEADAIRKMLKKELQK